MCFKPTWNNPFGFLLVNPSECASDTDANDTASNSLMKAIMGNTSGNRYSDVL